MTVLISMNNSLASQYVASVQALINIESLLQSVASVQVYNIATEKHV